MSETPERLFAVLREESNAYKEFMNAIVTLFGADKFTLGTPPLVYAVKSRIKSEASIKDKIGRKTAKGAIVDVDTVFDEIADYAGVRVLHLHNGQFEEIHQHFISHVEKHYFLDGKPEAYSWDSNRSEFYKSLGIDATTKESYYTSVHYTVRPRENAFVRCEVQIRTLFEEIWGEIDHTVNYPHPSSDLRLVGQIKAFSKLVACGSTLAESIFEETAS